MSKKLVLCLLVICIAALPPVWSFLCNAAMLLQAMDVEKIKEYILSFGLWAPCISFLLMIFQAIVAPLPAFLITFANAALFGWIWGALLSWTSAMVGALLCFLITRVYGRSVAVKFVPASMLDQSDSFFTEYGKYAVLIARLLPFISFDVISYAAGLTSMKLRDFLIATGLGQIPATLVYSYIGKMLTGKIDTVITALFCLFVLVVIIFTMKKYFYTKHEKTIE